MNKTPLISVVMPVYNGAEFLKLAITSILEQSLSDFELIVVNDASRDDSAKVINSFHDRRIRLVTHTQNLGITKSLNHGIQLARGKFIARMDQDDISLPQRFESQVKFLNSHPQVGFVGTAFAEIDQFGQIKRAIPVLLADDELKIGLEYKSTFAHGSVMFTRALVTQHALTYSDKYKSCEDWYLWRRIAQHTRLANLPAVLYLWRNIGTNMTAVFKVEMSQSRNLLKKMLQTGKATQLTHQIVSAVLAHADQYKNRQVVVAGQSVMMESQREYLYLLLKMLTYLKLSQPTLLILIWQKIFSFSPVSLVAILYNFIFRMWQKRPQASI